MAHTVTFIRGDGTGPELAEATARVLEATGAGFEWDWQDAGADVFEAEGTPMPERVLDSIKQSRVAIKAPITTPVGSGFRSVNVALRKELDLYSCQRPCKAYEGVRTRFPETDIVIIRENHEDLYAGIEFEVGSDDALALREFLAARGAEVREDAGISIKPISVYGTQRIVRSAFEYAKANGRGKVTAVHKANIMKFSDGLFLKVAREVAQSEYPDVEFEDRIVDNMCNQLVSRPEEYDVVVLPNLYGDIVSDLGAGMIGGLGMAPGGNIGDEYAVFEATHGSAPKYKGLNKVNPSALILSGVMMLRHLGEREAADRVESALAAVIKEGRDVTYDMKPTRDDPTAVGTSEMADAIIAQMEAGVTA